MSEYSTPEAIPSRKDIRRSAPVTMDAEQHYLLTSSIVELKDSLRRHNTSPDRHIAIYEHALADQATGRQFNLELYQDAKGSIERFETTFYGGHDNSGPISLSYKPAFMDFNVAYQYTSNVYTRNLLDAFGIIASNTDLDLSHYLDRPVTSEYIWQIAELLRFKAADTPDAIHFSEERYRYTTSQEASVEFIAQDINTHTMRYVVDVSTATGSSTDSGISRALTYDVTINSINNSPIATTTHEISSRGSGHVTEQEVLQMTRIDPELAYISLNDAIKALHPIE